MLVFQSSVKNAHTHLFVIIVVVTAVNVLFFIRNLCIQNVVIQIVTSLYNNHNNNSYNKKRISLKEQKGIL